MQRSFGERVAMNSPIQELTQYGETEVVEDTPEVTPGIFENENELVCV